METTGAAALRTAGLRVTRPRLSVLRVLAERPHADADAIVTGARALHAGVDCAVGAAPCLEPSDAAGFVVDGAEVVFWGLCLECQVRDRPVPAAEEPVRIRQHATRGGVHA
jgi:Fe2+ or Zn2+ uptake regulation protein